MNHLKTLTAASIAATALVALMCGASASAATVICAETGVASPPCNVGTHTKEYAGNIIATSNNSELVTNIGTVKCHTSTTISPEASTGSPTITAQVTAVSTDNCKLAETSCEVTVNGLPYTAHIEGTVGGNTNSSRIVTTNPSKTVRCGSFINCTFGRAEVTLNGTNGSPTKFSANKVELNREGGFFCPSTSTWTATYSVTAPAGGVTIH